MFIGFARLKYFVSCAQVVSAKGLLKECQFCFAPFWRDETILRWPTSVLWNLDVPNYQPSLRTFISDMLELINQRPKSADQKRERNKIILFRHVCFDLYFLSLSTNSISKSQIRTSFEILTTTTNTTGLTNRLKIKKFDFSKNKFI